MTFTILFGIFLALVAARIISLVMRDKKEGKGKSDQAASAGKSQATSLNSPAGNVASRQSAQVETALAAYQHGDVRYAVERNPRSQSPKHAVAPAHHADTPTEYPSVCARFPLIANQQGQAPAKQPSLVSLPSYSAVDIARPVSQAGSEPATTSSAGTARVISYGEEARNNLLLDRNHLREVGQRFQHNVVTANITRFDIGMRKLLVGQDEAIDAFREVIQVAEAGLAMPGRPIANFLFLGPTGSGKTKALESAAEVLTGNENNLFRIDCGELQHSHEIAKLIGSPPGYLGHRETKPPIDNARLTEMQGKATGYNMALVLFDEIEKASDALWNLLLGILDKATLTLGTNERVDFSRTIIGMTSNLGAKDLVEAARFGYVQEVQSKKKKDSLGVGAARKKFSPEFFNRLDRIITFGTLGPDELRIILGLEMLKVQTRVTGLRPFLRLFYTEAVETLLVREGNDQRYGARPLKRAIHRRVVMPLSAVLSSGQIRADMAMDVLCDYDETLDEVFFSPFIR